MAGICHLAAAEDGTINNRIARGDADGRIGRTTEVILYKLVEVATATAIDITHFLVTLQQVLAIVGMVTYSASSKLNFSHTVVIGKVGIVIQKVIKAAIHTHAGAGHRAAAIEIAQNGAFRHRDRGVAAHTTTGKVGYF